MSKRGENIRKRKDGRWEGRYAQEIAGEKKYYSVYAKTYSEVKKKLTAQKCSTDARPPVNGDYNEKMTLHELSGIWFTQTESRWKYSTYRKYMDIYENYIQESLGKFPVVEIHSDMVAKMLPCGLSASTYRSIYCVLNQILSCGNMRCNLPGVKLQPNIAAKQAAPIEILSVGEQKKLLECMYMNMDTYKLGIIICLYTGLRLGEICSLKWEDIDFQNKTMHVTRTVQRIRKASGDRKTMLAEGTPKTACSKRIIPLPDMLLQQMQPFKNQSVYVLNGNQPMDPRTYQYRFQTYLRDAGIPKKKFHILRHTFATNCISSGADVKCVSELLGHSSVTITLNKYVHPAMDSKRSCLNSLISIYGQIMGHVS